MPINVQSLQKRFKIVDDDGTPSSYFLRWLRDRGNDIVETSTDIDGKVDDTTQVIAGTGLDGGGTLDADVTLNADEQDILDQITTTRGAVLYRGETVSRSSCKTRLR